MSKYLVLLLFLPCFGFSQTLLEKTSVSQQLEDFEILKTTLLENHLGLYDYTDSISFNTSLLELKSGLNSPQTILSQLTLYKKLITDINCIHSQVIRKGLRKDFKKFKYQLPFSTYFVNEKLFVSSEFENESCILSLQDEILEINGEAIKVLTPLLHQLIPSDGRNITRKNQDLKNNYLLYYFMIKQKSGAFHLKYTHKGDTLTHDFLNQYPVSSPKIKKKINQSITFKLDSIKSYAVLILPYPLPSNSKYKKELDNFFCLIDSIKINNLILDLRNNGGGQSQEYLAGFFSSNSYCMVTKISNKEKYFTYKKHFKNRFSFKHIIGKLSSQMTTSTTVAISQSKQFTGNLSVLINGNTASAASNLASSLKEWSNAFMVGEESGGGYRGCNSDGLILELPNSKIQVVINVAKAVNTVMNTYENDGVSPHVYIVGSNLLNPPKDLQLDYLIDKLNN